MLCIVYKYILNWHSLRKCLGNERVHQLKPPSLLRIKFLTSTKQWSNMYEGVNVCATSMQIAHTSSHSMLKTLALNSLHANFMLPILLLHISVAFMKISPPPPTTYTQRHKAHLHSTSQSFTKSIHNLKKNLDGFGCRSRITTRLCLFESHSLHNIYSRHMWKWCEVFLWVVCTVCNLLICFLISAAASPSPSLCWFTLIACLVSLMLMRSILLLLSTSL